MHPDDPGGVQADGRTDGGVAFLVGLFALILGFALLISSLVPNQDWALWFRHPLRSANMERLPVTASTGILLLRGLLPTCGICWMVVGGWMLRRGPLGDDPGRPRILETRVVAAGILGLVILGLAVRVPLLQQGLWYDEIAAFWYYGQFGPGPIIGNMFTPANHVLQTLASWSAVVLNGGTLDAMVLRFPAVLLGLLAIWPTWVLIRDCLDDRWALAGCLLVVTCPIAVLEGTEARGYAFMLFFSTGASALLARYLDTGKRWMLPVYALCCALGIWSHLVTVVVPMGHACVLVGRLACRRGPARRTGLALLAILLAALTTVTFLAPVIPELLATTGSFRRVGLDQPDLLGREGGWIVLGLGGSWTLLGGLAGLAVVLLGVAGMPGDRRLLRTGLVCGAPIAVALGLVLLLGTWIYARFLVLGIPFTILAATAGLRSAGRVHPALAAVLAGGLLASWGLDLAWRMQVPRQPVREIVERIPVDRSRVGTVGVVDLPIIVGWYLAEPERVIDLGPSLQGLKDRPPPPETEWLVLGYPRRNLPTYASTGDPGIGNRDLVEGFVVVEHLGGWIDDDGAMLLLRREPVGDDQS